MRKTLLEGLPHSMMETILWLYHTLQDLLERLKGRQKNISSTDYLFFVILSFTSILLGKEIISLCCFSVFMV